MDCKACRERFRVDKLIEENVPGISVSEATSLEELTNIVKENHIKCPSCGKED
jgi:glycyl-tRNA synthetase